MSVTPRFEESPKYIFACDIRNGEMNIISCLLESAEKIEEAINYSEMIERAICKIRFEGAITLHKNPNSSINHRETAEF